MKQRKLKRNITVKKNGKPQVQRAKKKAKVVEPSLAEREAFLRRESIAAKRFEILFGDMKKIPVANIPKRDGANPYIIAVKDENRPTVMGINSPLIGTLNPKEECKDILRNSLKFAEAAKFDAVILTGNIIYCLVEKYGKQRSYRTQVVGVEPNPKLLELAYPKAVLKKIGPLSERIKEGKVVFMTIKVYLDHVFQLVHNKFRNPDGTPIYNGNIYISLGEMEDSIAAYYANEALRAEVFQEKSFAQKAIAELRIKLREAHKAENKQKENELLEEINDWQIYDHLWVLMGHADPPHTNTLKQMMINYLVHRLESEIPNAKVIGIGDAFIKAGKRMIPVVVDKTMNSVRGGLAGRLRKGLYNYMKANPGDKIPDIMLGGGMNPWGTGLYATSRSRDRKSTLDDVRMAEIIQLPVCMDSELYRETVRRMLRTREDVSKLAKTPNFQSGVQVIRFFEPGPIPRLDWLRSEFLTNGDIFCHPEVLKKVVSGEEPRSRMIYAYKEGCTHNSAAFIARYESPGDPNGRYIKYHYQVLFEAFVRDKVPIHLYQNDGDIQHWLNYPTYKEVNPHLQDPENLLDTLTKLEKGGLSDAEKIKAIKTKSLLNAIVAGVIQPEEQIESYGKSIAPYVLFYREVIERAKRVGIKLTGNLGYVCIGQGNHNENSFKHTDLRFSEARLTRKEILLRLMKSDYNPPDLEECVAACQIAGVGIANGTFKVSSLGKDAYEYCLFMMHKHGSSKTEDNMKTMITNFSSRGTSDDYEEGRFTVNLGGDDHMGGHAVTRNAFHIKTGGQMFNGPFGLKNHFPKQNLFSAVWGVPAGGPAWGPCSIIRFDFRATRKLAAYQITLPPELFSNPVE